MPDRSPSPAATLEPHTGREGVGHPRKPGHSEIVPPFVGVADAPHLPGPRSSVPAPGSARLVIGCTGGTSFVSSLQSTNPLRLLAPVSRGLSVWTYLSSFGGGHVGGDQTRLDLHLDPGARGFVGSQSATKIYRNPDHRPCGHITRATLAPGSFLACLPAPVQPFAEARFRQDQEFHLDPAASLVLLDAVTAGRPARAERWAFHEFESRTRILVEGRTRFLDALSLNARDGPLAAPLRLGRFNCLAALVLIGPALREPAAHLLAGLASRPIPRNAAQLVGASPLAGGALVRIAGTRTENVLGEVRRLLDFLPAFLGDDPWLRQW